MPMSDCSLSAIAAAAAPASLACIKGAGFREGKCMQLETRGSTYREMNG